MILMVSTVKSMMMMMANISMLWEQHWWLFWKEFDYEDGILVIAVNDNNHGDNRNNKGNNDTDDYGDDDYDSGDDDDDDEEEEEEEEEENYDENNSIYAVVWIVYNHHTIDLTRTKTTGSDTNHITDRVLSMGLEQAYEYILVSFTQHWGTCANKSHALLVDN